MSSSRLTTGGLMMTVLVVGLILGFLPLVNIMVFTIAQLIIVAFCLFLATRAGKRDEPRTD
jgi:hypothetical protein